MMETTISNYLNLFIEGYKYYFNDKKYKADLDFEFEYEFMSGYYFAAKKDVK